MNQPEVEFRYIHSLLDKFDDGQEETEAAFGRHIHWGYWENPREATGTAEDFGAAAENMSKQVCAAAEIKDGMKVLDVGCGFGGTVGVMNDQFSSVQLHGVNVDERQLERARQIVPPRADNSVDFHLGNACDIPLEDETFDVVTAVECIFHFPSRLEFFQEAQRVLRPGGRLVIVDYVPRAVLQPLTAVSATRWANTGDYGKFDIRCTLGKYNRLARQTGFQLQNVTDVTRNTLPTCTFQAKVFKQDKEVGFLEVLGLSFLKWTGRLSLLRYMILSFTKS